MYHPGIRGLQQLRFLLQGKKKYIEVFVVEGRYQKKNKEQFLREYYLSY